eukprot:s462_g71.t1
MWKSGKKLNFIKPADAEYIFISSTTGFSVQFLHYHDAMQFRGYISNRAIAWSQRNLIWEDDYEHAKFRLAYGSLLLNVMEEFAIMWKSTAPKHLLQKLRQIEIDSPLCSKTLESFHSWWQHSETPKSLKLKVKEFAMDGHEKVATKCHDQTPARGGRQRKVGSVRFANVGRFMVTDPGTGSILGIQEK